MRTGPDVYRELQHHAATARREVEVTAGELQSAEKRMQDVLVQRADSVKRLAQHYLPDLEEPTIANAAAEVQGQLRAIRDKQQAEIARLRGLLGELADKRARQESECAQVTAKLEECVEQRTRLEQSAAKLLEADAEFKRLATTAAEHERRLARDEERAQEMAREAMAKLPAYERSRLFQYLIRRKFGTPEYRAFGLTRSLDRWVANMVDFARAKQGYDFLRVTPPLVAAEVTRRREEFAPVLQQLHDKQAKAAAQVGLPAVLEQGMRLGKERDALVAAISATQEAHRAAGDELAQAESQEGRFYEEALAAFRGTLERTETRSLELRARITPEPQDDALVREIGQMREEEAKLAPRLRAILMQRTTIEAQAAELERLVRRFHEANFDAARSRFEAIDVAGAVHRFRDGQGSLEELWLELRRRQRFEQPVVNVGPGFDYAGMSTGTRVLLEAMGHVVAGAMRGAAQRSVLRGGFPSAQVPRGGGGGRSGGGFTHGAGF